MATSGKLTIGKRRSIAARAPASKRSRMASPPAAASLPMSAVTAPIPFGGMRFEFLLPLPIISKTFGFLTCVNLSSMGLDLADVPPEFGWDLELFVPILEQPGVKSSAGPSEVQTEVVDLVDVDDDSSLSEGDSDDVHITGCEIMLAETRSGPVSDFSEPQPEAIPIFEERLNDFAEKLADIDVDLGEGPETPVENVQTTPMQTPQTGEGQKKKRIKVPAGRTDLPLVRQFKGMQAKEAKQAKASSLPS